MKIEKNMIMQICVFLNIIALSIAIYIFAKKEPAREELTLSEEECTIDSGECLIEEAYVLDPNEGLL